MYKGLTPPLATSMATLTPYEKCEKLLTKLSHLDNPNGDQVRRMSVFIG